MSPEEPSYHEVWQRHSMIQVDGETYLAKRIRIIGVERYWGPKEIWDGMSWGTLEVQRYLKAGHGTSLPEETVSIRTALKQVTGPLWEEIVKKHYDKPWSDLCLVLVPDSDKGFPLYKLLFPEYLFDRSYEKIIERNADIYVRKYYEELANQVIRGFDNRTITFRRFCSLFEKISTVTNKLKDEATWKSYDIKVINQLSESLTAGPDVLLDFLRPIFNSIVEALVQKSIISQCQFCDDYFVWVREKKYCSVKSERKDCAKKAAWKRYYAKHGDRIREKSKNEMRETRALFRKHGLKK